MGGEKASIRVMVLLALGSPPHGRGKGKDDRRNQQCGGITPAWAGKRRQTFWPCAAQGDHPRMGGEKARPCIAPPPCRGSPPHGRGKERFKLALDIQQGITPAWAGKRATPTKNGCSGGDHPRMGGEKPGVCYTQCAKRGSPPHGRGKEAARSTSQAVQRITPAWAGKSRLFICFHFFAEDHPRMGGEKVRNAHPEGRFLGSPPHGRGKETRGKGGAAPFRITPAWAGKRLKRSHRSGIFISGPIPFHSVLHRPAGSGGSRAGRDGSPAGQPQNAGPA